MALTSLKTELLQPMLTTDEYASLVLSILYRHDDGIRLSEEEIAAIKEHKPRHELAAGLEAPMTNKRGDMLFYGSTAVIPVIGGMFKRGDWMTEMCGMVSTQRMIKLVGEAADNPEISQIVLEIDSPGGMVSGTHELYTAIQTAKESKPVIAYVQDAYSAAYYIASACSNIYLSSPSSGVGSIGVATQHIDMVGFYTKQGLKVTDIASEGKRTVSQNKPLDKEAKEVLQNLVNSHYSVFLSAVAEGRNSTPDAVHEDWGKGKLFIGDEAIALGMADGYMSLEQIVKGETKMDEKTKKETVAAETVDVVAASPDTVEAVTVNQNNETVRASEFTDNNYAKELEQKNKQLMNLFGNISLATEMKASGKLTPHAFATVFGNDTSNTEATLNAIKTFCDANSNDPVRAALNLVNTMGGVPEPLEGTVGEQYQVIERPAGSPKPEENKTATSQADTIVAGLKLDI